jgi:hypothetical protein
LIARVVLPTPPLVLPTTNITLRSDALASAFYTDSQSLRYTIAI